jgi:hypothetical protein
MKSILITFISEGAAAEWDKAFRQFRKNYSPLFASILASDSKQIENVSIVGGSEHNQTERTKP